MKLRRFKPDSPMDQADHLLEWLMEVSNVAFYCDLTAEKRRLICGEMVRWRGSKPLARCCFAGVGRACPVHEGGRA